jgi:hypothetical protein
MRYRDMFPLDCLLQNIVMLIILFAMIVGLVVFYIKFFMYNASYPCALWEKIVGAVGVGIIELIVGICVCMMISAICYDFKN